MVVVVRSDTAAVGAYEHSGLRPKTTSDSVIHLGPRSFLDRVLIAFPFTPSSVVAADLVSVICAPLLLILIPGFSVLSSPLPFIGQAFLFVGCTPFSCVGVLRLSTLVGHDWWFSCDMAGSW